MTQWVKHLPSKPDDQSSNPQYPHEMPMALSVILMCFYGDMGDRDRKKLGAG